MLAVRIAGEGNKATVRNHIMTEANQIHMEEGNSLPYFPFNFLMYLNANYSNCFCFKTALRPLSAMISSSPYRDVLQKQGHSNARCLCAFTPSRSSRLG